MPLNGWRGLANAVLGESVRAMRTDGAGEIRAWMGPAIGQEAFEVGVDVRDAFEAALSGAVTLAAFRQISDHSVKFLADLPAPARLMLAREGVTRVHGLRAVHHGRARAILPTGATELPAVRPA